MSVPLPQCRAEVLPTRIPGTLTVAAAPSAAGPWFAGDPAAGRGLDPAIVYAVTTLLGFPADRVRWVRIDPRTAVLDPGARVDLGIGELPIPDQPGGPLDYSTGYFPITQVVLTRRAAAVTPSLAGVRGLRLAAARGSRAAAALAATPVLRTAAQTAVASPAAAVAAVRAGTADAAAVDILTATAAPDLRIVGELPPPTEKAQAPQLGLVLPAGSKLTPCVSTAIDLLRVQGTLSSLKSRWVPVAPLR